MASSAAFVNCGQGHSCQPHPRSRASEWVAWGRSAGLPARTRRHWCGAKEEDIDVTTFRFTLGNEDWDNAVPRVVGLLAGAGMITNHLSAPFLGGAQWRSEALGAVLCALCIAMPSVELRIRELTPGKGRRAMQEDIAGSRQVFKVAEGIKDSLKNDLAWASFTLIKSTNACTVVVTESPGGRALVCRGAVGATAMGTLNQASPSEDVLAALGAAAKTVQEAAPDSAALYLPDKISLAAKSQSSWTLVPAGCSSLLVTPLANKGHLILMSEQERAFSVKERAWVESVARKLAGAL